MSKSPNKAADFLKAMQQSEAPEVTAPAQRPAVPVVVHEAPAPERISRKAKTPSRAGLKHFGGYLDDETLEKIALLRVRLKKDNSELMTLAIEELYAKHKAKRAFGDA